jgi:signal transduction histidine kinase
MAAAVFAVDLLGELAVDLAARPARCAMLFEQLEREGVAPHLVLGRGVLRSSSVLQLPVALSLEVQLALLLSLTEATAVSLWRLCTSTGDLKHIAHAGEFNLHALATRRVARRLVSGEDSGQHREGSAVGVVVNPLAKDPAALVARGVPSQDGSLALLEDAVPVLTATLARDKLLNREKRSSRDRVASAESRLARLRFDLHDGPQQDAILLAEDLRLLRDQLGTAVDGHPAKEQLVGRIDDLVARLVALDGDLRQISATLGAPLPRPDPTIDVLLSLTSAFAARTGIEPQMSLDGDFNDLTDSQLTTLLTLLREALTNIRKHSKAANVQISLSGGHDQLEVTVTDDGCGFDPERELVRAAREGHIGLASLYQRVRKLGGHARIESRPGGPTVISATLPPANRKDAKRRNGREAGATIAKPRNGLNTARATVKPRNGRGAAAILVKPRNGRDGAAATVKPRSGRDRTAAISKSRNGSDVLVVSSKARGRTEVVAVVAKPRPPADKVAAVAKPRKRQKKVAAA